MKIILEFDSTEDANTPLVRAVLGTMAEPKAEPKADEGLMARAIDLASELMAAGNVRELRNQLSQVGASRVKSMDAEQLQKFVSSVEALDA